MNLPFEQLASYDKPQLLLTQALDNELTIRGALQTLVDVNGLSPNERDLFTTRLKDRVGRNPITDSAIDILTNPFVLLMAVTSPVGGQALSRTGKAIFDMSERFSPFVKEQGGLLGALGFLAPMQLFRGTALTPAVQALTKGVDQMEKRLLGTVGEPLRQVLTRHGLDSLNPEMVRDTAAKAKSSELNDALWAAGEGMHLERTLYSPYMKKMDDGTLKLGFREEVVPKMVDRDMEAVIDNLGLRDLHEAYLKAKADQRMSLYGNEALSLKDGVFRADEQKLLRMVQGVRMGFRPDGSMKGMGAEVTAMLLGPQVSEMLSNGSVGVDEVAGFLKEIIEKQPVHYMPRNVIDLKGARSMQDVLEQRRARSLVATGSTLSRSNLSGQFDPEDLERVFNRFGATEDGVKMLEDSRSKVREILGRGEVARVYKINAQESLARYFRDTSFTHALYVQTADELPLVGQAMKDTRGAANPEKLATIDREIPRSPLMDDKKSLAQVFQEEHYLMEDRFAKEALEVILRQASGVQKVEHAATHMALIKGKQALKTVLDSGIGKAMQESGSWGKGLYKRLDDTANAELTFGQAKSISGQLAKYFYVTHLGLNLSSVTMNMMQPLLMAATWGGLGNVMKAYKSAFSEMGSYITERVGKHGFKALTDEQHQDLIRKHFKYANVDGENLIQIGRDSFSTLDNISYKSDALAGVARKESYFFDYPMKMFEKAEWINRNVAAHTVENMYKQAGIDVAAGTAGYNRMLRSVDEMVSASQFGGSTLNTPMAFQGAGPFGRLGNNPLFRQFLSFPLRSVTALAYDSARLADRGALKGISQDLVRGMGISSIFYEMGKNTFGADLSPGLFGASLTQAVGGDRFFQDGNEYIPIPPVVDIPINLIRGVLDPGQRDLIQNNLPRLVPGGVAAARTMGMLPNLMEGPLFGLPGALQKTYVDFKIKTEDGRVPVYKADGTLIDYQGTGQIFAKALGVDFGTFKQTADFDAFLLKNRDQIVDYRRRAIAALLSNEIPKMQSIKAEFKRRYGMDLTISKEQLDQAMTNRLVSRTERIMDRIPPELRPQYQAMTAGRAPELGVAAEAITGADTARQRMQARQINTLPLTAEQRQVMAQETGQAFESFGGF
jgi:hypothetical protein